MMVSLKLWVEMAACSSQLIPIAPGVALEGAVLVESSISLLHLLVVRAVSRSLAVAAGPQGVPERSPVSSMLAVEAAVEPEVMAETVETSIQETSVMAQRPPVMTAGMVSPLRQRPTLPPCTE